MESGPNKSGRSKKITEIHRSASIDRVHYLPGITGNATLTHKSIVRISAMKWLAEGIFSLALCLSFIADGAEGGAPACKLVKRGSLSVTTTAANELLLGGELNGAPIQLQVDTAFEDSLLDDAPGTRTDAIYTIPGGDDEVYGFGNPMTLEKVASLKIANFEFKDSYFPHSTSRVLKGNVRGILGRKFLGQFDLDIDLKNNTIGLFENSDCGENSAYWTNRYDEVALVIRDKQINVYIEVNGVRTRALLNTGSHRSLMSWDFCKTSRYKSRFTWRD